MIAPNSLLAWRALMDKINKSSAGKFVGGATDMLLPEKATDLLTGPAYAVRHPLDSAQLLLRGAQDASQNQFEKMFAAPTTSEAIGHGLAGAIPMIGPAAGMAGEEIGAGNTARGLGMASALLAPSLYHGVKPIVGEALKLNEAVNRAKNIGLIRAARQGSEYDALANSARNANANAAATTPYPPMPDGPSGSLSQLRDDPNVRVPGLTDPYATSLPEPAVIDPLTGLPTRRDALKAGGAAALATAIGARAMEGMGKVPEVAAAIDAPVLGRAAPSALGRPGYYRDLKYRVSDGYAEPGEQVLTSMDQLPTTIDRWGEKDFGVSPNKRYFLTRAEDALGTYLKDVHSFDKGANLREALKQHMEGYDADGVKRVVHSEITPEAALRLNTIEKRQATNMVIGPKGGLSKKVQSIHDITNPDKYTFYKVQDQDGAILKVVASEAATGKGIPADLHNRGLRALAATARDMVKRDLLDPRDLGASAKDHLWETVGGYLEKISFEEAKAISNNKHGSDYGGLVLEDASPRQGISPRYTKRVSIRLLKDTMAAQIAENKRAAGKGIPPLLAKPPVLQDNPLLSRQDFFAGLRKK